MIKNNGVIEGIQIKKIPLNQQADSLFSNEDLMRLSDGDLNAMVHQYFGGDSLKVLSYLLKKRDDLLNSNDKRTDYLKYYKSRKQRERRVEIRLNVDREKDVISWLDDQVDKKDSIIALIRKEIKKGAK